MSLPGTVETFAGIEQRTDEWYAQRCGIITASAVGKLLSVRGPAAIEYPCPACDAAADEPCRSKTRPGQANKTVHAERSTWATSQRDLAPPIVEPASGDEAWGVVHVAAAERITGFVDPTFTSIDMQRGVDEEPLAVDAYSVHRSVLVFECGFMVRTWQSKPGGLIHHYRLGYSPDGLVGDDGLIEIKSRRGKKQVETVISGEVPAENMAQLQAGLFVSGREWIDYISYSAGMHLWSVRVYPEPRWFDAIQAAVEAFEVSVTRTVDTYNAAVKGLPLTERPLEDMVI